MLRWGIVLGVLLLIPIVWMGVLIASYYMKIQKGEIATGEERVIQESIAQAKANQHPTQDDLARLQPSATTGEYGSPDARVTVVEFVDYQCPYSQESATSVRAVMETYKDKVHFYVRDYPIPELHAQARDAALAANCALEQGQKAYWRYWDFLFGTPQDTFSTDVFRTLAQRANINVTRFDECMAKRTYDVKIDKDIDDAKNAGAQGTPTFFINGIMFPPGGGALNEYQLTEVIKSVLDSLPK